MADATNEPQGEQPEHKDRILAVRVTQTEWDRIQQYLEDNGLTWTELIRTVVLPLTTEGGSEVTDR